jgi:hypothetical protein
MTTAETATPAAPKVPTRTKVTDPKQKLDSLLGNDLPPKMDGFVDWISNLSGGTVEMDRTTLLVSQAMYSPFWRQSAEYAAIKADVDAKVAAGAATKSLETLKAKSPEDKRKALEVALESQKRAAERAAKIQAMLAEIDGEDSDVDDDDSENAADDSDAAEPEEY